MRLLLLALLLVACPPSLNDDDTAGVPDDDSGDDDTGTDDDDATDATAWWFLTCGDPVCGGYIPSGNPLCTDQVLGDPCSPEGALCDPQDDCNAQVVCAREDPRSGPCPISLRSAKQDIDYLDAAGVEALADQALKMKLAAWTYRSPEEPPGRHIGFIIDDLPGSPAVRGDRVDLYGYTTLAVAAAQAQEQRIEAQRRQIEEQQRRIEALERRLEALE